MLQIDPPEENAEPLKFSEAMAEVTDFTGQVHAEAQTQKALKAFDEKGNPLLHYELNAAPPVVKSIAQHMREEDIELIRKEAVHQWPELFIEAHKNESWTLAQDVEARERCVASAVGIVLGVTKLPTVAITPLMKSAVTISAKLTALKAKHDRKQAAAQKKRESNRVTNRDKNKIARKARRKNRK